MKKLALFLACLVITHSNIHAAFLANDFLVVSQEHLTTLKRLGTKNNIQIKILYPKFSGKDPLVSDRINSILEGYVYTIKLNDQSEDSIQYISKMFSTKAEVMVTSSITNSGSTEYFSVKFCQARNIDNGGLNDSEEQSQKTSRLCVKNMAVTFSKNTGAMIDYRNIFGLKSTKQLGDIINGIILDQGLQLVGEKDVFDLYTDNGEWFIIVSRINGLVEEVKIPSKYIKLGK